MWSYLTDRLGDLLAGKEVVLPRFNFVTGHKEYGPDSEEAGKK